MAIAVIAIAMVSLLALMPIGMNTLREAIDSGNEARIVQAITGSVMATEYLKLKELDFAQSGEILLFDDEGNHTTRPGSEIYGVKIFMQDALLTSQTSVQGQRVLVVVCRTGSRSWDQFRQIATVPEVRNASLPADIHVHSVLMAKMDGVPIPTP
jgi:uncharacterized protein (TIGR02598 family)